MPLVREHDQDRVEKSEESYRREDWEEALVEKIGGR